MAADTRCRCLSVYETEYQRCAAHACSSYDLLEPRFTEEKSAAGMYEDNPRSRLISKGPFKARLGESYNRTLTIKYSIQEDGTVSDATVIHSSGLADMDK